MCHIDRETLFLAIDAIPELRGSGVGYNDQSSSHVLRYSSHPTGMATYVILEQDPTPLVDTRPPGAEATERESHLWSELGSMGISCTGAVLTGMVVAGITAAVPFSAGTSTVLVVLTGSAALASSAQRGMSIGRVISEVVDPRANDILNSTAWVGWATDTLDVISLLGGVGSSHQAIRTALIARRAAGSYRPLLRGMNRPTRRRLARELSQWTRGQSQLDDLVRQGRFPSIYSRNTVTMALQQELYSAVSSAMTFSGSSVLSRMIVHLVQDH